jgi:hypothetical protein
MKKSVFFVAAMLLTTTLIAQKQIDDANAEVRTVGSFHGIKVSNGITVYLTQGNSEMVAVSANEVEVRNKIITRIENGILKIYYDEDDWKFWKNFNNKKSRAYVSVKEIDKIQATSGSDVRLEGLLKAGNLRMDASSGASINGKLEASSLEVDQSSGSVITISGNISGNLKVDGSSGSVFRAYDLTVENCEAETSSGAGVQVTVNKELKVQASSGGYIHYKGNALIRDVHTSSGGSVSRKS